MVYDGAKHFSVASISREVWERTITVNGFSKAYAMTGWRIGYAAARADVIKGIMAVQSQTTSATSAISQKAALAALQGSQHDMQVMVEEFKRRKDYVVQRLNAIEGITCPDVKGAFYVYPDVQPYLGKRFGDKMIENAVDLCQYLLDEALISTVPGEAYNVPGKIRISYSNSMENLEKALEQEEFVVCYQPVVDGQTGEIVSAEALVRWNSSGADPMVPSVFVPELEDSGYITKLDTYIDQTVHRFQEERYCQEKRMVPVAVNLSRMDLMDGRMTERIFTEIQETKVPNSIFDMRLLNLHAQLSARREKNSWKV